jgi:SERTA motif
MLICVFLIVAGARSSSANTTTAPNNNNAVKSATTAVPAATSAPSAATPVDPASTLLSSLPTPRLPTMKIDSANETTTTTTTTTSSDSIFGCVRFGSSNGYINKTGRPSMISAKYRLKEERRKVLKISIGKFKRIEDHESSLRRSVLINNTMKRLQKEAKEEKLQRQGIYQINNAFSGPELDLKPTVLEPAVEKVAAATNQRKRSLSAGDCEDCDMQDVLSHFYMPPTPRLLTSIDDEDELQVPSKKQRVHLEEEQQNENINIIQLPSVLKENLNNNSNSADDLMKKCETEKAMIIKMADADVVTMADISGDDVELDVVNTSDDDRLVVCEEPLLLDTPPSSCSDSEDEDIDVVNSDSSQEDERLRPTPTDASSASGGDSMDSAEQQHFSCGHSSIFGELQSVVFHSLIASLES